ncbi:hypothetical protein [Haloechinothrix halophila]|uniref:hypothetical protein n=1 Tax=Haloechinothrix halophila TaxID=1069073 RepID=UPI000428E34E|nr:hypothetical protein [Haloechinothrix halophila]
MIDLIPDSPLADRLNHAIATFDNAQEQLHYLRMLDAARIVRDALPTAEAVVVDDADFHVDPEGLRLHAILDPFGLELWTPPDPGDVVLRAELDQFRTRDGSDWEDVVAQVEYVLSSALGAAPPRSWWEPVGEHIDTSRYRAKLPSRDAVAEALAEHPRHLTAYLRHLDGIAPKFWLAEPVPYPTMTVDGVHVTVYCDADDGLFTVEVGTDDAEPPLEPAGDGPIAIDVRLNGVPLYRPSPAADADAADEPPARCRTAGCDGDSDDGEGWDGYCGNCADRREARRATD